MVSFAVGGGLVILFMLVYYRGAGLLADAALLLNVVFILAALAALEATVTLPGIAGLVLTLGMAVDANVLINERIREELRLGKSVRAAIEAGYERALPAILDSNITTFLSGLILFQFGSGSREGLRRHTLHRPRDVGLHRRDLHPDRLRFHAQSAPPDHHQHLT